MRNRLLFLVLVLAAMCSSAQAVDSIFWNDGGDFADPANWFSGTYVGANAYIVDSCTAKLDVTVPGTPASLTIGKAGVYPDQIDAIGTMNQLSQALTVTGNVVVGDAGGTGTYNMTGGSLASAALTVGANAGGNGTYNMGDATLSASGDIQIGTGGGTGAFNMTATTGTVTAGGFKLGASLGSTGTGSLNGGTITVTGETWFGNGGGSANFTITGGTMNVQSWFAIARHYPNTDPTGSVATLKMTGGTLNKINGGWLQNFDVGQHGAGNVGKLLLSGNAIVNFKSSGPLDVGSGASGDSGGMGYLYLTDNAQLNMHDANELNIGVSGSNGDLTMDGGAIDLSYGLSWWAAPIRVGMGGNGGGVYSTGTMTMNAGTISIDSHILVGDLGATGTVTMNGGTITKTNHQGDIVIGTCDVWNVSTTESGTGTWIQNGGTVLNASRILLAKSGKTPGTGTFSLNGGLVQATAVGTEGVGGNSTFHFNGGTLQASASSTTYMQGLTLADVQARGAVIDTQSFNITVAQSLLDGGGGGGLKKLGGGALKLNGTNTYTGLTDVMQGSLGGSGSIAGAVVVRTGAALAPGDPARLTVGSITFEPNSFFDVVIAGTGVANYDSLNVIGTLAVAQGDPLNVTLDPAYVPQTGDTFDVLDWGSVSGMFVPNLPALPGGLSWDSSNLPVNGSLTIVPEPGTIVLLLIGAVMLYLRRRR